MKQLKIINIADSAINRAKIIKGKNILENKWDLERKNSSKTVLVPWLIRSM